MADSPLTALKKKTSARVALSRAGSFIGTKESLELRLAHARARDAVHAEWDAKSLAEALRASGRAAEVVSTFARTRDEFLLRPDLGRRLSPESEARLSQISSREGAFDLVISVSDGLSAEAVIKHLIPFLAAIEAELSGFSLRTAPLILVPFGRVAASDAIGAALKARLSLILIGERPGLSSADSLSAYLTFAPAIGTPDSRRNCISNIRSPQGLSYVEAARKLAYLVRESLSRRLSGVELKDESSRSTFLTDHPST